MDVEGTQQDLFGTDWSNSINAKSAEGGQIELADWFGIFQKRHEIRRVDKSQTDQVIDRVPAFVTWITPRIGFELSPVRTKDVNSVAVFRKFQIGWVSSLYQKPMGHPVCFETAGFEATMATCFGFSGFNTSIAALISNSFGYLVSTLNACVHWFLKKPGMHHGMQRGSIKPAEIMLPQSKSSTRPLAFPACRQAGCSS
jgi:hypothetical protein